MAVPGGTADRLPADGRTGGMEGFTEVAVGVDAEPHEVPPHEDDLLLHDRERVAAALQQLVVPGIIDAGLILAGTLELAAHPVAVERIQRAIAMLDETITGIRSLIVHDRLPDDSTPPDRPPILTRPRAHHSPPRHDMHRSERAQAS